MEKENKKDTDKQNIVFELIHKTVDNKKYYVGLILLMLIHIITSFCAIKLEDTIYLKNILILYAIISGMGVIIALSIVALNLIIYAWEFIIGFIEKWKQ